MTTLAQDFLLIDPEQRPAARRYLERIHHLKHGTACYRCGTTMPGVPASAHSRGRPRCPDCAAPIDHRRSHGNKSTKPERWVEIAAYMLAGFTDAEIGRRLAWSNAAALCRGPLLRIMQDTEPELAEWWHAHIERDEPVLPAHLRRDLDAAKAAVAAGQGPHRFSRGKLIVNGVPVAMLDAMAAGLSDYEIIERYAASRTAVQSQWRPALQAWLVKEWPALGAWSECCRHQRRRALSRLASRGMRGGTPLAGLVRDASAG